MRCPGRFPDLPCNADLTPDMERCTKCSTLNPHFSPACSVCKAPVQLGHSTCEKCKQEPTTDCPSVMALQVCVGKTKDGKPCGSQLQPSYDFCPKCGTPVENSKYNTGQWVECQGQKKDGTLCRFLLTPEYTFCPCCGSQVDAFCQLESAPEARTVSLASGDSDFKRNTKRAAQNLKASDSEQEAGGDSALLIQKKTCMGDPDDDRTTRGAAAVSEDNIEDNSTQSQTDRRESSKSRKEKKEEKQKPQKEMKKELERVKQHLEGKENDKEQEEMRKNREQEQKGKKNREQEQKGKKNREQEQKGKKNREQEQKGKRKKEQEQKKKENKEQEQKGKRKKEQEQKGKKNKEQEQKDKKKNEENSAAIPQRNENSEGSVTAAYATTGHTDETDKDIKRQKDLQGLPNDEDREYTTVVTATLVDVINHNSSQGNEGEHAENLPCTDSESVSGPLFAQYADQELTSSTRHSIMERAQAEKGIPGPEGQTENCKMNQGVPSIDAKKTAGTEDLDTDSKGLKVASDTNQQENVTENVQQGSGEVDTIHNKQNDEQKTGMQTSSSSHMRESGDGNKEGKSMSYADAAKKSTEDKQQKVKKEDKGVSNAEGAKETSEEKDKVEKNISQRESMQTKSSAVSTDLVEIVFHVIISDAFKVNPQKDTVVITGEPDVLGAWNKKGKPHIMECKRITDVGYLYMGKVTLGRCLRNKGFDYKYLVISSGNKIHWEEVQRKREGWHAQEKVNRQFSIHRTLHGCTGEVHWYDGVAYPGSFSNLRSTIGRAFRFRSLPQQVIEEALMSGKEFLPEAETIIKALLNPDSSQHHTAEHYLSEIENVMRSLKLQLLSSNLRDLDSQLASQCLWEHVVEPILTRVSNDNTQAPCLVIFVAVLAKTWQIYINTKFINILCHSMLPMQDTERRTCPDLDALERNFAETIKENRRLVADAVLYLIEKSDDSYDASWDPSWLFCVPLSHFLEGQSKPFHELEPSAKFEQNQWWGIERFVRRKESFKKGIQYKKFPTEVIDRLKSNLQADHLLARTLVACLNFDQVLSLLTSLEIPLEVTAATLIHHIKGLTVFPKTTKQMFEDLMRRICTWLEKNTHSQDTKSELRKGKCLAQLFFSLHRECFSKPYMFERQTMLDINFAVSQVLDKAAVLAEKLQVDSDLCEIYAGLETVTTVVCRWMSDDSSLKACSTDLRLNLQKWGSLIANVDRIRCTVLHQRIKEIVSTRFEEELRKMTTEQKLEVFLNLQDQVEPAFVDLLHSLAIGALEEAFKKESKQLELDHQNVRLINLLSGFLEQTWERNVFSEVNVLHFITTWQPMINYLQKFGDESKLAKLGVKATTYIKDAKCCINHTDDLLLNGNIQMDMLQFLIDNEEKFLALVKAAKNSSQTNHVLNLRKHELKTFYETSKHLEDLFRHCRHYLQTGDVEDIGKYLKDMYDSAQKRPLCDTVPVAKPDEVKTVDGYRPIVNPWILSDFILKVLPDVGRNMSSSIFNKIFSLKAEQRVELKNMTFWRAFQSLWRDVIKEWDALCTELMAGSITLHSIEEVFDLFRTSDGSTYRYDELRKELEDFLTSDSKEWVDIRIRQFECYKKIKQHVKAATVLLSFKQIYSVPGQFDDMEKICRLSQSTSIPVSNVDESVLSLCKDLGDVQPEDVHCLEEFTKPDCVKFVKWLTKTMKGGLKELNVFVDLAFISAGEEPLAIARVNCLHAAATGYAPLIFSKIEDCTTLLMQCRVVFKNIRADPELPDKLIDAARCLDWFQHEEQSRGSVEKTSLSQVGNINTNGVFEIGNAEKHGLSLRQVISLDVLMDDDNKTQDRHYTYEELLDLQSRLMLVAGQAEKGKDNVDRFINIMDSLVRLGKTYVQLCAGGCLLYLNWSVRFLCDVKTPVCCSTVFSGQPMLKGCRNMDRHEDVEQFIAEVANFLECCYTEWLEYVDKKRKEYHELNTFTVEQLVFLQQELVKLSSGDMSRLVFPMLSLLRAGCSQDHLEKAVEEAVAEIKRRQCTQEKERLPQQESKGQSESNEQGKVFLQRLKKSGFPTPLAKKALKEIDASDIEGGIAWCRQHMANYEESDEDSESEEENTVEEEELEITVSQRIQDLFMKARDMSDSSVISFISNLNDLWRKFLEVVSSSGSDFLSLDHLGIILRCLASKDERHFERSLPPDFRSDSPNLILCPKSDVLNVVTYTYMFPENGQTPLPQPDEVLLCTEDTTVEEVDIFLRRAFFRKQQKIYCLAYADSLEYDVGVKVEKKIQDYITQSDEGYNLVVICTSENEYKARIVAALEKHRRPTPALSSANTVRKFLLSQFSGLISTNGMQSASALDPESLCVRVIKSQRSGVGKTLYKQRLVDQLCKCHPHILQTEVGDLSVTIPLHTRVVHTHDVASILLEHTLGPDVVLPRIIHLDISYEVQEGVDNLLYNLLVLGCIKDNKGKVWLRSSMDLYLVESMPLVDQKVQQKDRVLVHHIFDVLPNLTCWAPQESLAIMRKTGRVPGYHVNDRLFDDQEFRSELFQRPYYYLRCMDAGQQPTPFTISSAPGDQADCLATLLRHCGVQNPSWAEVRHFVHFLNKQLQDFEHSVYCSMTASQDLPGFSLFVLRFLIQMSRDFATRSLKMSEESLSALMEPEDPAADIEQYELRRTWESSPHPYIFFNPDANSMTFLGFSIRPKTFDLMDQQTGQVLVPAIMNAVLFRCLILNRVPLTENFDVLPREDRLVRLYRVMGLHDEEIFDEDGSVIDPDDTYELTTDNVKKILAIYLRFRCNIPVVVMGETGCGKTTLVDFLCALQTPGQDAKTMVKIKVHGGTTGKDIIEKVKEAERLAEKNAALAAHRPIFTVLFFDEANTTEAIGVIKEIMCDGTLSGKPITLNHNLKMVAACNPYRKHSDDLIQRLENAGLGYHIEANKTTDKLGRVPMRRLVYRVQPLPQSMLPLVWDFGQLNTRIEELYIHQMVRRCVRDGQLSNLDDSEISVLCGILIKCQEFMRQRQDECSFVSLRDVSRALTVASWFLPSCEEPEEGGNLLHILDEKLKTASSSDDDKEEEEEEEEEKNKVSDMTKALVLALATCYRACLDSKSEFDEYIVQYFHPPFALTGGKLQFFEVIDKCQDIFLENIHLEENIARNQALKENVFMMVVCIELRIPLFLVGKPGSSKSLARTVVEDAMQGISARSQFFRRFKQVKMVSFQCSPLATADGILATFHQCAQFQQGKNPGTFVSVVVLDEVGLAEDSPKMPLKTLHSLLEEGCPSIKDLPEDCRKVAFIGISNWALDPAKMNRGILVQRGIPNDKELVETARGICTTEDQIVLFHIRPLMPELAGAYLDIFEKAKKKREFFGLRDFYSLVKMVYASAAKSRRHPSRNQMIAAILRNFGGLDTIDPVAIFFNKLPISLSSEKSQPDDPDCTPAGLIKAALKGDNISGESRYLLLLTENYGGISILFENLLADQHVVPIFGSSFPKDQEYTQVCRNINRIKVCMEMGQTVILLNLENLYESLYDALNQYYALFGGERYVDLGLGTHRVKCKVHRGFRLIVVAEKQIVYESFPIPLINRLEKHFLTLNNILTKEQLELTNKLEEWAKSFANGGISYPTQQHTKARQKEESVGDAFMGYHPDTAAAVILKTWDKLGVIKNPKAKSQVLLESKKELLWCATPDAVVRAKREKWSEVYFNEQQHEHLTQYLQQELTEKQNCSSILMAQVTTHSKLLTEQERQSLCNYLQLQSATLLSLQAFDTEQQFRRQLETFFENQDEGHKLLLVQSDCGDGHENLVKCAQYCMQDLRPANSTQHHVIFIIQLPRVAGACFSGFLGGNWHSLHIDDLRASDKPMPSLPLLQGSTPSKLLRPACNKTHVRRHSITQIHAPDDEDDSIVTLDEDSTFDREAMEVDQDNPTQQLDHVQLIQGPLIVKQRSLDITFIKDLLTSCLQPAVALVRDQGTSRATRRVTILLSLLQTSCESEDSQFFLGLCHLICNIMEQKEEILQAQDWLIKEAARLESVKKAGTFRRSWMQCIERKVISVFAGIIAYLDTNGNLDLLYSENSDNTGDRPPWVKKLWLEIFLCQDIEHLNFRRLQSMLKAEELEEFAVHSECAGAAPFSSRLPFSWILLQFVENTLAGVSETTVTLGTADTVVEDSPICRCIKTVLSHSLDERNKLFELYIWDLLHFSFALTSCQRQILYQSMVAALAQAGVDLMKEELGPAFVAIHKTLHNIRSRLHAILDMSNCRPSALQMLLDGAGCASHLMTSENEMTQDVALLTLMVENLKPSDDQFEVEDQCQKWVSDYNSIAPIITRIISDAGVIFKAQVEELEDEEVQGAGGNLHRFPYGRKCIHQLRAVSCLWTQASTVKLFLDFTEPLRKRQSKLQEALKKDIKYQLLWNLLGEDADLKTKKTLEGVDTFLKRANGHVIRKLLGKMRECDYCKKKIESAPIKLPCNHNMCSSCGRLASKHFKCPQCDNNIPKDWKPGDSNDSKERSEIEVYQRQISGFLMAVVSHLCFAGQEPPERKAVEHIFGYIIYVAKDTTLQTKHMTAVNDLIDPTPVLRSFLLRLLLRHKETDVIPHLEEYYNKSLQMLHEDAASRDSSSLLELSLLIVHCIEDFQQEQELAASKAVDGLVAEDMCETLRSIADSLHSHEVGLPVIFSLGKLRFTLDKCTNIIQMALGDSDVARLTSELEEILKTIKELCQLLDIDEWPKKFFIKQLCRKFGVQTYLKLASLLRTDKTLDWFVLEETEVQEVSDRYLTCDKSYRAIREGVAQLKVSQDKKTSHTELKQILKNSRLSDHQQEVLLMLALHREVTMTSLHQIPQQVRAQTEATMRAFIQNCDVIHNKGLAHQLCQNEVGATGSPLRIHQGQDLAEQGLVCLLTHLLVVLQHQPRTSALLLPLCTLIHNPSDMHGSFLPTMPQDNLEEILKGIGDLPELYHCPNGHRYIVGGEGQCKMPVVEATCNVCGARIGGINHVPTRSNVLDARQDHTQTGHILGAATLRAVEALPERNLSPVECSILRFFTHAALYLGASSHDQALAVAQMVQPRIQHQEVCQYFWNHLEHDLHVLSRAFGRSPDEVFQVLHHLCHQLTRDTKAQSRGLGLLKSKNERLRWERMFADEFIKPVIQKLNNIIRAANEVIVGDNRQGYCTLLNIVHETNDGASEANNSVEQLPKSPAVWRYRPVITVDHFFREFHLQIESRPETQTRCPAISLFRAESHILRALHYVPAMLEGQRCLMSQVCRRLSRDEASVYKISAAMKDKKLAGLGDLMETFCNTWEIVKEHLITYRCRTPMDGLVSLPEEFHNYVITRESPVAVLLPSTRGPGLCAYILVYYLLVQHNEILHRYCKLTKQRYDSLPEVEVQDIQEGQLVAYTPEELLPLVLSHCNHNLKLGESTCLDYDFEAFERHLIHSFMQCKSLVRRDCGCIPVKTMVYKADTSTSRLFRQLRDNIQQESLSPGERRQIIEDLRGISADINDSIDNLNTTLLFLRAVGGRPDVPLHTFMAQSLKMKTTIFSRTAQQLCCLKHIQSLWIVLCHERASILATYGQEAFDSDQGLGKELNDEQKREVKTLCEQMSVERLELLLLQLFECIMLHLSEPVDQDADVDPLNYPLQEVLVSNLESPLYQVEPVEVRSQLLTPQHLTNFPASLTGHNSIQTWYLCHRQLREKKLLQY